MSQGPHHTSSSRSPHAQLCRRLREDAVFASIGSIVSWDEQTQMPPAGTPLRADQQGLLARLIHQRGTDTELGDLISAAEREVQEQGLPGDAPESAVAREARRDFDRAKKLPSDLVEELARAQVEGHAAWVDARKGDDFTIFRPFLERQVDLKRREADCIGWEAEPYDALLDDYEPHETTAGVRRVFDSFKEELIDLVGRIGASGRRPDRDVITRRFPVEKQREVCLKAAGIFGFDFNAGRLDVAVHPFCSGFGPGDTRITTRFDERDIANSFFSTLHETGHATYEQGLPKSEQFGNALGVSVSLGIHESQSRMWENLVGRSAPFWEHFWPTMQTAFPEALGKASRDEFLFAVNDIRPSFIRTEADEATYNLHILLRFELETALMTGDLAPADMPDAWDRKMRDYLGITPIRPSEGCLQDIHWSSGYIGYFPTYTLGNLYAAQFFEAARRDLGDLDATFARGNFQPLLEWLRANIHSHGSRYTARELVQRVTGRDLTARPLMEHLKRKGEQYFGV